jgi:hypothetical protein
VKALLLQQLQQLAKVYDTITFGKLFTLFPFLSAPACEEAIAALASAKKVHLRFDHKKGVLIFKRAVRQHRLL